LNNWDFSNNSIAYRIQGKKHRHNKYVDKTLTIMTLGKITLTILQHYPWPVSNRLNDATPSSADIELLVSPKYNLI
jgi:hypothetical protein